MTLILKIDDAPPKTITIQNHMDPAPSPNTVAPNMDDKKTYALTTDQAEFLVFILSYNNGEYFEENDKHNKLATDIIELLNK